MQRRRVFRLIAILFTMWALLDMSAAEARTLGLRRPVVAPRGARSSSCPLVVVHRLAIVSVEHLEDRAAERDWIAGTNRRSVRDGRTKGVLALRAHQLSARRVYQAAALP